MTAKTIWAAPVLIAAVLIAGCKKEDDEFAPAVVPKTYAFEGKVDPKFAGSWESADHSSTMEIEKDGGLKIDTTSNSVVGKSVSHVTGNWLVNGNDLMFRYTVGTQTPTVLKYVATLSGNTLTLKQAEGRQATAYKRKS